mmetsp:Transcript_104982/g.249914  ORF Transcript_104982/g.249914 Transcript_104982/m.249914 type:complete len:130 (+) Transcript_104982:44-433(+)
MAAMRHKVLLCPLLLFAARAFVGLGLTSATADARRRVAMKSILPPQVNVPFLDQPVDGWTFAVYMFYLLGLVVLFGAYQLWRLFFSRELGTYGEIKWGGARPPKEYIEEMKQLEARRKKKFLRSITDGS